MRVGMVALTSSIALTGGCQSLSPVSREKADPRVELVRLNQRSAELRACTVTYVMRAPDARTIRFTYISPDHARLEMTNANDGGKYIVWILGNRSVIRSEESGKKNFADATLTLQRLAAVTDAIEAGLRRAFPTFTDKAESTDFGAGAWIDLWIKPDRDSPGDGEFFAWLGWMPHRTSILEWLDRMSSMPVVRDDGNRIAAEDPATQFVITVSKSNGFIESVSMAGTPTIELSEWNATADPSEFTIPDPAPDANDISDDFRKMLQMASETGLEMVIDVAVRDARKRETISDDELRKRLKTVYDVAMPTLLHDELATGRDFATKIVDEAGTAIARLFSASPADPDLRQQIEPAVTRTREEFIAALHKMANEFRVPPPSPADPNAPTRALMDDVRRQAATDLFEREIVGPAIARLDERTRAARERK